ncbi:hypothetical protein X758_05465 [Mesorhizobium sp. LSHC416B00]|nr:hypothetical protein X761_06490 [Mesorhizobium sp. LSHC424B00]ESX75424.1 hypothetical protein X758_05465 [Mesorhizobium sp. LSHC416B00]
MATHADAGWDLSYSRRILALKTSVDGLPTADEPAGISTTEEAGLWLRFFVVRQPVHFRRQEFCAKKKPAGIDRRASTVAGAAF